MKGRRRGGCDDYAGKKSAPDVKTVFVMRREEGVERCGEGRI